MRSVCGETLPSLSQNLSFLQQNPEMCSLAGRFHLILNLLSAYIDKEVLLLHVSCYKVLK